MTGKEQYYNTKQYAGAEKNNLNRKKCQKCRTSGVPYDWSIAA